MSNITKIDNKLKETIQTLNSYQFQQLINKKTDDYFQNFKDKKPNTTNNNSNTLINLLKNATPEQLTQLNIMELLIIAINNMNDLSNNNIETSNFTKELDEIGTNIINKVNDDKFLIKVSSVDEDIEDNLKKLRESLK